MLRILAGVGLLVVIGACSCSKQQPAGGAGREGGGDSSAAPAPGMAATADLILDRPGDSTEVFAGVMTQGGDLIPLAVIDRSGEYRNPWSAPAYEGGVPPLPSARFPRRWYLYTPDDAEEGTPVHLRALHLRKVYCGQNWAFGTDRSLPFADAGGAEGSLLGVVFTVPMTRVSFLDPSPEAKRLESVRFSLGLVSNNKEEPDTYEFALLGYFRVGEREIGVGQSLWYESTEYVLFEIQGTQGRVAVTVDGGGC